MRPAPVAFLVHPDLGAFLRYRQGACSSRPLGRLRCLLTGQRLYRGASVHYRDETEIYGFVAPGGLMTVSLTALGSAGSVAGVSRARAGDPLHGVRTPFTGARSQSRAVMQ